MTERLYEIYTYEMEMAMKIMMITMMMMMVMMMMMMVMMKGSWYVDGSDIDIHESKQCINTW